MVLLHNLDKQVFSCFDTTGDAFFTMPSGFSIFSNAGETKTLNVISTVAGVDAGFSIQGTPPSWLNLSISGNVLTAIVSASDQLESRYYDVVLIQDGTGKTITKRVTQAASSYVLTIGAITSFSGEGGSQTVSVTSTFNGLPVSWVLDTVNSSPYVSITSGEGTSSATFATLHQKRKI